jgi:hypothetical protein
MREILHIFRKDVRHLWPRIIPVLVLTGLRGWLECKASALLLSVAILWLLSWIYLGASVIHEERLPGHQQYWLTRPYHRRQLLLSKVLFLMVFAVLPHFLIATLSLYVNGVSPLRHVSLVISTTLVFAGGTSLVVAAVGSLTENLIQLLWGLLVAAGLGVLGVILAGGQDFGNSEWGSVEWVRSSALGIVLVVATGSILVVQYWWRKTAVSLCILSGAIVIAAGVLFLGSWHEAWAIESQLSSRQLDRSSVRIAFDPTGRRATGFAEGAYQMTSQETGINLPVLVTGVPAGTQVISERIQVKIEAPGGRSWSSTWTPVGGVIGTNPMEDTHVIRRDGPYWQYVNVDRTFCRDVKDTPVHVRTTVALILLGQRETAPLATRGQTGHLPGDGFCGVSNGPFERLIVSCAWPSRTPARSYVLANSPGHRSLASLLSRSVIPYEIDGSVWDNAFTMSSPLPEPFEMHLETWQAVAHFEREVDVAQIRLGEYAIRRITDPPVKKP